MTREGRLFQQCQIISLKKKNKERIFTKRKLTNYQKSTQLLVYRGLSGPCISNNCKKKLACKRSILKTFSSETNFIE